MVFSTILSDARLNSAVWSGIMAGSPIFSGKSVDMKLETSINTTGMSMAPANITVHAIVKSVMPVVFSNHSMNGSHTSSIITVWLTTIPISAVARKESSNLGFLMNQSSLVGGRGVIFMASCGQFLIQFEQKLQKR